MFGKPRRQACQHLRRTAARGGRTGVQRGQIAAGFREGDIEAVHSPAAITGARSSHGLGRAIRLREPYPAPEIFAPPLPRRSREGEGREMARWADSGMTWRAQKRPRRKSSHSHQRITLSRAGPLLSPLPLFPRIRGVGGEEVRSHHP